MHKLSHLHFHWLYGRKELRWLFASKILRSLSEGSVFLFLPIYLYQIGSTSQLAVLARFSELQRGIITVCMFYLLWRAVTTTFNIKIAALIGRVGLRSSMVFGTILYLIGFLLLNLRPDNVLFLLLPVVVFGFATPWYWLAYYTFFARNIDKNHSGADVSLVMFFSKLLHVVIPASAGALFLISGYSAVIGLSTAFFILSIISLLQLPNDKIKDDISLSEYKSWMKESRYRRLSLAFAGRQVADVILSFWPLYLLLVIGSVERVGYVYSLAFFFSLLITYFTGWYIDHRKSKRPFYFSGCLRGCLWGARILVSQVWGIIAIDTIERLAASIYEPFFDAVFIRRSKGREALSFYVYREISIGIVEIFFYPLMIILFILPFHWSALFVLAAFGMILSLMMDDKKYLPIENTQR